ASGPLVESLQRTLNARIEAGLGVDGDFGSATEAAVKKFQWTNKLPETGMVDSATWLALGTLIEEDEPVPAPEVVNSIELPIAPALDVDAPPEVTATAWTSVDMATGGVLGEVGSHQRLPIASTTKVMTAYLVFELAHSQPAILDEMLTFSERADNTLGSTSGVRAGETLSVRELMYGLLLPSGNDAAVALAEHFGTRLQLATAGSVQDTADEAASASVSYEHFVAAMNRRAAELGMDDSHFTNPHGLPDDEHLSSAADLAILARAAWELPQLRKVVRTRVRGAQVLGAEGYTRNLRWENTNRLLGQAGFSGMKTGTTNAAGACLIAVGKPADGASEVIVVVLGSASSAARYVDARNLFAWSWRQR
ncbi:MAG: peptidoglycan-binding protein, partial [Planctomycetales bacterium]|nr:peptidoglycan-binding protein [Planctomycetales bacterium]